jgi:hypothetical protein
LAEEIAPPFESWPEHLGELDDRQLRELAKDYRWLDEETFSGEGAAEFHRRREQVIAELERRGMTDVANECRQPSPESSSS